MYNVFGDYMVYIELLILEDLFISCGLVLIYILKKNAIWEDLPFLILVPFLIPSIIIVQSIKTQEIWRKYDERKTAYPCKSS